MKIWAIFVLAIYGTCFGAETTTPRKPANRPDDVTQDGSAKPVSISNKYCTLQPTGSSSGAGGGTGDGDDYAVVIHIIDPKTGKELKKEIVVNPVMKVDALKLLNSANCN